MKISVINSTTIPVKFGSYGFEQNIADLSLSLAKNNRVTLFAPTGSDIKGVKLVYTPNSYHNVSINDELFVYRYYHDVLMSSDYIIDASATNITTEQIYFYDRIGTDRIVWLRNGTDFNHPRKPASQYYKGVVLSKKVQELARDFYSSDKIYSVYPGVNENIYTYRNDVTRDYYLYYSRPHPSKGLFDFIKIAKMNPNKKFVMSFDMDLEDHKYYGEQAIKMIKGMDNIRYIPIGGDLNKKVEILQHAIALIVPLSPDYIEGFGMVFIEAIMTGTPVITRLGSTPQEYLSNDVAIFCSNPVEYSKALDKVLKLDNKECRDYAVERFTTDKWAERMLKVREY